LPPGVYDGWGSGPVELQPSGRLTLMGTPYLAGATVSLAECVGVAMRYGQLPLHEAIQLASANPARVLRLDTHNGRGSVRVGASADLTVFTVDPLSARLTVEETIVAGMTVYERAGFGNYAEPTRVPVH
jgi:N-acetylglucosamine-6-phosphate deacetylase